MISLFKAGSAGSISCRFSTSSSTTPRFLVIFINIILNWMVVDAKAETSFFAPDDLDFFYKSDNARKMLFYFQVSNNNREERHQKSEETGEDEAAINNSVESWIGYWYLLLHTYQHIHHCQPEETDEDRAAHENLKKSKPSERSVVAMQAKYKVQVQVQAKYKVAENISIFCVDRTKNQVLIWPKNNLWSVICLTKTLRSDQELPCSRIRSSRARKSCSSPMALMQLSRATACIFSGDSKPLFLVMNYFVEWRSFR